MVKLIVVLLGLLHTFWGGLSQTEPLQKATISSSLGLLEALVDENVTVVVITGDFQLKRQHWPYDADGKHHLALGRNVSMVADPNLTRHPKIDMAFLGTRVAVQEGATLSVRGLHFVCGADHRDGDPTSIPIQSLVPFFASVGSGRLVYDDIIAEVSRHPGEALESHATAIREHGFNASFASKAVCLAKGVSCPLGGFLIDGPLPNLSDIDNMSNLIAHNSLQLITEHTRRHILQDAIVDGVLAFRQALEDPHVGWIFFVGDIVFDIGQWPDGKGNLDETLVIEHRVWILTHPWVKPRKKDPAVWDMNLAENMLTLKKGVVLKIKGMVLKRAVPGKMGIGSLAFIDAQQGGLVRLDHSVVSSPTNGLVLKSIGEADFGVNGSVWKSTCSSSVPESANVNCAQVVVLNGKGDSVQNRIESVTNTGSSNTLLNFDFDQTVLALGNENTVGSMARELAGKGIRVVTSEGSLQSALLNKEITTVWVAKNLELTEGVWGDDTIDAISLKRGVTITPYPGLQLMQLDTGTLANKVQPAEGVVLRLEKVDLGNLEFDMRDPRISIPFVNLDKGGVLEVEDAVAYVQLEQGVRLKSGGPIKLRTIPNNVAVVSNEQCEEIASIGCPQKAFHLMQWSSTIAGTQKGHTTVTNSLVVGRVQGEEEKGREGDYNATEDVETNSSEKSAARRWMVAAIVLAILTAAVLIGLVWAAVTMTRLQKRKDAARCRKQEKSKLRNRIPEEGEETSLNLNVKLSD